jgi:hypothetical protein
MPEPEHILPGGNVTGAVRIGETVHRQTNPWSPAVHGLLLHLQSHGFQGSPRFLGLDDQGREILSYIQGEIGHYPLKTYMWSDENLVAVAHFLHRYHDASSDYHPDENTPWQFVYPDHQQHEIICHNDVAPYNMVYRHERPYALIDFDTAGPGPRIWDIAYAVYRFVPLSYAPDMQALGLSDPPLQSHRLHLFCRAYGLQSSRSELLATVILRLSTLCDQILAHSTEPAYHKMIADGHLDFYRQEISAIQNHRSVLEFDA